MKVRTRLAPSPTGYLHLGSLHTFLYNYYFTKKNGGEMVLRVEDTDRTRYVEGAIEALIAILDRMGISYDEGPMLENGKIVQKGSHGPYIQSERLEIYREHAKKLIDVGHAYYCFCSKERLSTVREEQQKLKRPTKYDRTCLALPKEEIEKRVMAGESHVIRMQIPEGKTTFVDEIRGEITIDNSEMDDQVILKADGFPTYHLAVVVDDFSMEITHIIRAEEWISSVPKHLILYEWFGYPIPSYAHLPLILNPDKSKLSKRQGDVSVESYLEKGFLKEALLNFIAILGFNPSGDQEIYTQEELMHAFEIKKVSKSGPIFDVNKLLWMNGQYIKALSTKELVSRVKPFLDGEGQTISDELLGRICDVEKTRMSILSEINELSSCYRKLGEYSVESLVWKKSSREDAHLQLSEIHTFLSSLSPEIFEKIELLEEGIKRYIEETGKETGNVLWPLRVSLSGKEKSASPFELAWVIGREETLSRILHATALLSA
ncbi:MAG: glutamate--tRNA ligase [Patescibacteria group bacterium]